MALVIASQPPGELLTVEEAKRHLRVFDTSLDDEVTALIRSARDYCERQTSRTFRASVTRTLTLARWWPDRHCHGSYQWQPVGERDALKLPWPPLLGVTSIAYYDADNASQTLSSTNYQVELSTDGCGRIIWTATATRPVTFSRPDAVTVTFTTGYADATALPPVALQAMKTKMTELWGSGSEGEIKAAGSATDRLLSMVDWTGYA